MQTHANETKLGTWGTCGFFMLFKLFRRFSKPAIAAIL